MVFRILMMLAAAAMTAAGITAAAFSLTHGQTDQAIAFAWPALASIIALGLMMPTRKQVHADHDRK
ncbi:MAG: hypothetical protein GYB36_14630 [Alphaproteobacteria bacterium]|nr:hypothetical protein [Alphaproteobacteria bacterium]